MPFDVPVVAHDMLSRFLSTDYISAAGAAAGVPSRIGSEEASIIGETHLNGTALDLTGSGSKEESAITGLQETTSTESSSPVADAYYNVGAAILILLVLALGIIGFVWRQRRRRHGRGKHSFLPTSKSENGNGLSSHLHQHRRNRSSASDRSYRQSRGVVGDNDDEANELLAMEKRDARHGGATASLPRGEELFSVGEEDEDEGDSDEEGNIGRAGRKLSAVSDDIKAGDTGPGSSRYDS